MGVVAVMAVVAAACGWSADSSPTSVSPPPTTTQQYRHRRTTRTDEPTSANASIDWSRGAKDDQSCYTVTSFKVADADRSKDQQFRCHNTPFAECPETARPRAGCRTRTATIVMLLERPICRISLAAGRSITCVVVIDMCGCDPLSVLE